MKILITGGDGYICKSIFDALKTKYNITTISRDDCDLTSATMVNDYFLDKFFDVVIHCAACGSKTPREDNWEIMNNNLKMYYNLLNNRNRFGKFINFGSGAEIFSSDSPYGLSKKVIYKSISNTNNFYNIRIFAVFDENELNTRFIKNNINRYIKKESILIHQNKIMDFFYMGDLIKLVEYYVDNEYLPKEIDCKYSNSFSLKEIAHVINNLNNYQVNIEIDNQEEGISYIGNYADLNINYVGLQDGIKETYNNLISKKENIK